MKLKFKKLQRKKKVEPVIYKKPTGGIVWNKPNQMSAKEIKDFRNRSVKSKDIKKKTYKFKNPLKSKKLRLSLALIFVVIIVWQVIPRYSDLPFFKIKEIQILGIEQVNQETFSQNLEQYKNKSLINISTEKIEKGIKDQYDFIDEVYVRKIMPDKLQVEVVEKYPVIAYINLKGAYLLDRNYFVVSVSATTKKQVTQDDLNLFTGNIDINSNYLKERYLLTLQSEEERANLKWEEVDQSKKTELLNKLKTESTNLINSIQSELLQSLASSEFSKLITIQSYSQVDYKKNEAIEPERNEFVNRLYGRIKELNIQVLEIRWISDYTLQLKLQDQKTFLFSIKRTIDSQISDLSTIIYSDVINQGSTFDLRSETYSVR